MENETDHPHISRNPGIYGGVPIVNGVRFTVSNVLGYIATGKDPKDFQETWGLTEEMIRDAVAFAQDVYEEAIHPNRAALDGDAGLLLCPFCGSDAFIQENRSTSGSMVSWQARCTRCRVGGEVWGDKSKTIRAWNTRAATQATASTASVAPLSNDPPASSFPSLPESELNDPLPETLEGNFRCPRCLSEYKKG